MYYNWLTTEHYFQAQKFVGTPLVGTIQMLERPREAFEKSRDPHYSKWRRSDWESVKEDVMYKALQAKFTQHEKLRRKLLETGDRELIEHSPHDSYWGDGGNGMGKNRLGELLMKLRREMKEKEPVQPPQPPPTSVHPEPPKQQVTMGNSSGSNESNKQPELDQHNKDAAGQSTQHSPPPLPRDNKGAGAQLPTPSSTPTAPQPDPVSYLNQSGNHQSKNDPSCSNITSQHSAPDDLMGTYQIGGRETTSSASALTRNPLHPPGFPERVPPTYADVLLRGQPQSEGGTQPQPLGLQSQPTNVPPSVGTSTAHAQSSHPPNHLGEGGPQPQPKNNPEDELMDTN